jgi:uncharacterized membrane protein (UPF0182 family)
MSPVNTADADGLPTYFIADIDHTPSDEAVRRSIPVGAPAPLLWGTDQHLRHDPDPGAGAGLPSGSDNLHHLRWQSAASPWNPLATAAVCLASAKTGACCLPKTSPTDTRLLYRRSITDRVQAIAPFLRFDTDPYLVSGGYRRCPSETWGLDNGLSRPPPATPLENSAEENPLTINCTGWVIDAYTTSDRYPYSDPWENATAYT